MDKQPEEGMTKYAVDEGVSSDALEKAAANGCPICGSPVEKHGQILVCPTHGTKPFETSK